jgi:TRAP-type C4-dicarboxylate transport system substrate-binding protein
MDTAETRTLGRFASGWLLLGALCCAFAASAGAEEIKIATVAPDGSRWMQEMRAGGDEIRSRTEGRVLFKFYPGGVMGSDTQVLRKIRVGQLHGGAFTSGGIAERYSGFNLYGIPLLFQSLDEVDFVRARLDPELAEGLEQAGFVSFGFVEGGFAQIMANEPIRTVDDMRRRKVWSPEGDPIGIMVLEAMGLSPVVLPPTDVLTGLQTGLLDVVAASPVVALVLQWHTKVHFVTDLPIAYSIGILAIDKRIYSRLTPADQAIVAEVMQRVTHTLDDVARRDNIEARQVMESSGLEFVPVNQGDISGWRRTIEGVYPALRSRDDIEASLFDELLDLLSQYREQAVARSDYTP